jgi:Golgi apparatus protein 1
MRAAIGIVMVGLCLATAANAQRALDPCVFDMQTFCGDVEPGAGRMLECLHKNDQHLSANCKEAMAGVKQKAAAKRGNRINACQADIDKLCKDVPRGGGRLAECLRSHSSQLSAACKEALKPRAAAAPTAKPTAKK